MKLLKTFPHLTNSEIEDILKQQRSVRAFQDWQIIYSVQTNSDKTAEEFASILGTTKSKVYYTIQSYNKQGKDWRSYSNWGGRREERCILTLEEEKTILNSLEQDALSGKVLIYKHVKDIVEKKINREVSDDYIWDMFKRHNWSKKAPRQSHPKANKEEQEDYKKNSKKIWLPSH